MTCATQVGEKADQGVIVSGAVRTSGGEVEFGFSVSWMNVVNDLQTAPRIMINIEIQPFAKEVGPWICYAAAQQNEVRSGCKSVNRIIRAARGSILL